MGKILVIAALLAATVALGGCGVLGDLLGGGARPPAEATTPTPAREPPTPSIEQATPTSQAGPTLQPTLTQEEAQAIVRAWFEALGAEDYQRAEELTTGSATRQTRQLVDTIRREESQRGVQVDLVIRRLELQPGPQSPPGQTVHADFDIDANAMAGPFSVRARSFQGSATFLVQQTESGPRISDIRDVSGLPTQ